MRLRGTGSSTIFADGAFLPNTVCGYDLSMSYKVAKGLSNFAIFSTTYGHLESAEEKTKQLYTLICMGKNRLIVANCFLYQNIGKNRLIIDLYFVTGLIPMQENIVYSSRAFLLCYASRVFYYY